MPQGFDKPQLKAVAGIARELSDPVRIAVADLLGDGPRTASQLADELGISAPRLANHLARLRAAGTVAVTHSGRHAIYRLTDARLTEALNALRALASTPGQTLPPPDRPVASSGEAVSPPGGGLSSSRPADSSLAQARTCYDHLAGRLGVAVFDHLVAAGALLAPPDTDNSEIVLGPGAAVAFAALGVDVDAVSPGRRKAATTCLDWTERRPHLGGALGAAILASTLGCGWVRKDRGRLLTVTSAGRKNLPCPVASASGKEAAVRAV
jgi:DNA-binding transcriptional ArsR family regulator